MTQKEIMEGWMLMADHAGILALCQRNGAAEGLRRLMTDMYHYMQAAAEPTQTIQPPQQTQQTQRYNIGESDYSQHPIQVWDIIDEYKLNYYEGNIVKYLLRKKGTTPEEIAKTRRQDLKKAEHYLQKLIKKNG